MNLFVFLSILCIYYNSLFIKTFKVICFHVSFKIYGIIIIIFFKVLTNRSLHKFKLGTKQCSAGLEGL